MVEIGDLTEPQRAALAAIIDGRLAWSPTADLAEDGHGGAIGELVGLGLAERWGQPHVGHIAEDRITLTPFGAWLMGVHILERMTIVGEELSEDPYWAEATKEPLPLHLPKRRHEIRWPWMDELPDPDAADPAHGPEFVVDEVSGKEVELFTKLFDGREVKGIPIRIDKRLKGKGKAKATKRRKAG